MSTAAIANGGLGAQQLVRERQDRGVGSLKSEDFFRIMVTELQQQDPLQPSKTSDMISQVSQIRSIELSGQLTNTLDQLAAQQRTAGTSELLGKYIVAQFEGADGQPVNTEGVVTGVRYTSDGLAILDLDNGGQTPASAVSLVTTVEQHEQMTAAGATAKSSGQIRKPGWLDWLKIK